MANNDSSPPTEPTSIFANPQFINDVIFFSSCFLTLLSICALLVNLYLLLCSRFLRKPIGVNLRLCVALTASDALCAFFYILSYFINLILPESWRISNCWSLLIEVCKVATFFSSVFTLLALAFNHYVGIVYPLYRHSITPRSVRTAIAFAYTLPAAAFLAMFCILPGGFRADVAFDFFSTEGCKRATILRNQLVRWVLVAPFILCVLLLSFLYMHILVYMRHVARDPLLVACNTVQKRRTSNRKLLVTLVLLAGSAILGWLPTTVLFVLTCDQCIFKLPGHINLYIMIFSHFVNILKLLADGFIYASRLIEVKYALWAFKHSFWSYFPVKIHDDDEIPQEFARYLSETVEHRSTRKRNNLDISISIRNSPKSRASSLATGRDSSLIIASNHRPVEFSRSVSIVTTNGGLSTSRLGSTMRSSSHIPSPSSHRLFNSLQERKISANI